MYESDLVNSEDVFSFQEMEEEMKPPGDWFMNDQIKEIITTRKMEFAEFIKIS